MRNKEKFNEKQKMQIKHWKKKMKNIVLYKKIEVLDYAAKGYTNEEISKLTEYTIRRITGLISEYLRNGIGYFLTEHRKGGNSRRNLTDTQERSILEKYKVKAENGQIVSLRDVKKEYENVYGKEIANSTFYDFLKRMEWRRIMPRGAHPKKASNEVVEDFKKELTCG